MTVYMKLDLALKKYSNKIQITITIMSLKIANKKINVHTQPIILSGCAI